ncbi:unnamed protein product, partial [Ectocarpus sp. 12 AP-2014]
QPRPLLCATTNESCVAQHVPPGLADLVCDYWVLPRLLFITANRTTIAGTREHPSREMRRRSTGNTDLAARKRKRPRRVFSRFSVYVFSGISPNTQQGTLCLGSGTRKEECCHALWDRAKDW